MPRTRPLTQAAAKAQAEAAQRERTIRIISSASAAHGFDRQRLSSRAGMDYQVFSRRMRGESDFRLQELCSIADALGLDAMCRAALCGAKEKCRYESGYKT